MNKGEEASLLGPSPLPVGKPGGGEAPIPKLQIPKNLQAPSSDRTGHRLRDKALAMGRRPGCAGGKNFFEFGLCPRFPCGRQAQRGEG